MKKAVFLDRDGVINIDHGYIYRLEDFTFINGIFEACQHLQREGYLLVVVTNQSGIARGLFSEADFQTLTNWMLRRFHDHGIEIAAVYHCPHHPEYGPTPDRHCQCRKPAPGMLIRAINELGIDPTASLMIGDKATDLQAAVAAGVKRKILVRSGKKISPRATELADEIWDSVKEALTAISTASANSGFPHGNK